MDLTCVKTLKFSVNASSHSAQLFKIAIQSVELVQDLTLECCSQLIVQVVELVYLEDLFCISQVDKASLKVLKGLSRAYSKLLILVLQVTDQELILVDQIQGIKHVLIAGKQVLVFNILGVLGVEVLLGFAFGLIKDIKHKSVICSKLLLVYFELIKDLLLLVQVFDHALVIVKTQGVLSLRLIIAVILRAT